MSLVNLTDSSTCPGTMHAETLFMSWVDLFLLLTPLLSEILVDVLDLKLVSKGMKSEVPNHVAMRKLRHAHAIHV